MTKRLFSVLTKQAFFIRKTKKALSQNPEPFFHQNHCGSRTTGRTRAGGYPLL